MVFDLVAGLGELAVDIVEVGVGSDAKLVGIFDTLAELLKVGESSEFRNEFRIEHDLLHHTFTFPIFVGGLVAFLDEHVAENVAGSVHVVERTIFAFFFFTASKRTLRSMSLDGAQLSTTAVSDMVCDP